LIHVRPPVWRPKALITLVMGEYRYYHIVRMSHARVSSFMFRFLSLAYTHRRCIYKGDTSTHAQGTDPRVALGA